MLNKKDQHKFINKMRRDLIRAKWLRFKANTLRVMAFIGTKSIVLAGKKFHWINDNEPIKNRAGREYVKMVFTLAYRADNARDDYKGFTDTILSLMKAFNNQITKQNRELLSDVK